MMASLSNCKHKNPTNQNASLQTCEECKDLIYGERGSQLKCNCDKYFHLFCLRNPPPSVTFRFGSTSYKTEETLKLNRQLIDKAKCEACRAPMEGSRYTHSSGKYSVHPECAINLVPSQINAGNGIVPPVFNDFLKTHPEYTSMEVKLDAYLPAGAKCMICNHSDDGPFSTPKWSYVITQNGQQQRGCHLSCVRGQLINPSATQIVDLEKYYSSVISNGKTANIIDAVTQYCLEPVIDNTVLFPFNKIIICAVKFLGANHEVRRYPAT